MKYFSSNELNCILPTSYNLIADLSNNETITLSDKFYVLSIAEIGDENTPEGIKLSCFIDNSSRVASGVDDTWWLRTPFGATLAQVVVGTGNVQVIDKDEHSRGVRPVCKIDASTPVYLWSDSDDYYHLEKAGFRKD